MSYLARILAGATPAGSPLLRPDLLLFHGGVFKAEPLRRRVVEMLAGWYGPAGPPEVLDSPGEDLDLAVSRGAAYYGLVRRGEGVKVAGGTARSFYIGLAGESKDGRALALCVAPQGLEEGEEVEVAGREFELLIRHPVQFPLYTSGHHPEHEAGDLAGIDPDTFAAPPPSGPSSRAAASARPRRSASATTRT